MGRRKPGSSFPIILFLFLVIAFLLLRQQRSFHGWQWPGQERSYHRRAYESHQRAPYFAGQEGEHRTGKSSSESCSDAGTTCTSEYFHAWRNPGNGDCSVRLRNGYPEPDPRCTPGGTNPSITLATLQDREWRTGCVRNCQTSEAEKHVTYEWYRLPRPHHNSGANQVCELDHLVPLELGGADGLGNIWPECGPADTVLRERYFKVKDRVENYLADEVRTGRMPLHDAQRGIAEDWTQYLEQANQYCQKGGRC
ncbi:MAG: hypothetical protein ACYC46_06340 [Acidobacteriaceae bacterium]